MSTIPSTLSIDSNRSPLRAAVRHESFESPEPTDVDAKRVTPVVYQEIQVDDVGASSEEGFTLLELEQLAMENNPAIKQVSASANRAAGIRDQVGRKPNPQVGYFGDEIGDADAAGLHGAFVSQTIVAGQKLERNRHVLQHDVRSMMWQVETQRVRVRTDLRKHFFRALAAQRRLQLAREFRGVAEKGVSVAKGRLEAGGTRPDVLQSEIQLGEIDLLVRRAEMELDAAWKAMAAIVGLPAVDPMPLIGELESSIDHQPFEEVLLQIVAESPLLRAAQEQVRRARANLDRQNAQPRPNVTGQLGVGHDDATGDEFANVQLTIPLPVHNANQGNIRAAYGAYCEATQNVERIKMEMRESLATVTREFQIAAATVEQYESKILPKARESQELISEAYAVGEFDFLRVLTARRIFFDANLQYVAALGDLAVANATIDGLLLSGGLSSVASYGGDDALRGQALSGQ